MVKESITRAEDVPDFDKLSDDEMLSWLESHEISAELQLELFSVENPDAELRDLGLDTTEFVNNQ